MRRMEVSQGIRLMKFEEILDRTRSRELSRREAASVLGVSEQTFRRWRDRYHAHGADERIAISNYEEIIRFYVQLLAN